MKTKDAIEYTANFSLLVQIIIGIISFRALFFTVENEDISLMQVMQLETIVQFVEAAFYVWLIFSLYKLNNNTITSRRYIDWVITTPIMLFTTVVYMRYNMYKSYNDKTKLETFNIVSFFNENQFDVIKLVGYNFLMLLFGYLGEINMLTKYVSVPIGFIFFAMNFKLIYDEYVVNTTQTNEYLFNFLLIVWGLYGVAAVMPIMQKNVMYNLLDIVSKNFYGLFIYYKLLLLQK